MVSLIDFNPRAPYGARQRDQTAKPRRIAISIHAPHTGRDQFFFLYLYANLVNFNPRAPYGARRSFHLTRKDCRISIHAPHTGRDPRKYAAQRRVSISIHAPHTGRDCTSSSTVKSLSISIHAPHTGRDMRRFFLILTRLSFQSTRPIRGATSLSCSM